MPEIRLPHNGWRPRKYQEPLWRYLDGGGRLASAIWHRRAGKDDVALHHTAKATVRRPAVYWHMLPKYSQARKAIWTAVNPHTGQKRIDEAFPMAMRRRTDSQTMTIETVTGSVWQVVGSDNPDSLVGSPPAGVVFSEWALSNPMTWAFLRPILRENGGWALFITTPRGRNHAVKQFETFKTDPRAFAEVVSAADSGRFTPEELAQEKADYLKEWGPDIGESLFSQEYLCDFDAPILGAYYARLLTDADRGGRILPHIWDPRFPVETWWDLGISDATAIWFVQVIAGQFRFVDFLTSTDSGLDWYAAQLLAKPYQYSRHILPHDGEARELGTGLTRQETLRRFLPRDHRIVISPLQAVDDGINAVRQILPKCWFDRDLTAEGLEALRSYHREWDVERKTFKDKPEHDWSSHPADAFRTGAMMWRRSFKAADPVGPARKDRWKTGRAASVGSWAAG